MGVRAHLECTARAEDEEHVLVCIACVVRCLVYLVRRAADGFCGLHCACVYMCVSPATRAASEYDVVCVSFIYALSSHASPVRFLPSAVSTLCSFYPWIPP